MSNINENDLAKITKFAETLHWIKIAPDGVPEFYIDNHMLQTFRACEAKFVEEFINGRGGSGKIWFLEFGSAFHKAIEEYYIVRQESNFDFLSWVTQRVSEIWDEFELDQFKDHPMYKVIVGKIGFVTLLMQYAQFFNLENERFRVIGTELYFGRNKEVPILADPNFYSFAPFRLYLSGKIDLLIDDGFNIGPMDHKTSKSFMGKNPVTSYEIQDGMTGYVYATKKLLPKEQSDKCKKIWMNFVQVTPTKEAVDRFKRIPMYKSDAELEMYRQRQISTVARIYQLLVNYDFNTSKFLMTPQWNTMMCSNYMHQECSFKAAHRQKSFEDIVMILDKDFVKKPIWNPEIQES